ncbi:Ig-like domain-containing protein [Brevibacillus reuszeri]|uniref:Ig-like domain-containing protein n=1 Tax=Brevibacillus reuszeri TaxID=54915 RepID=UPI0035E3E81E
MGNGRALHLSALAVDGYGGTATISNLTSSNPSKVTLTIENGGHLTILRIASGTETVSYEITDSRGGKSTITYTVIEP